MKQESSRGVNGGGSGSPDGYRHSFSSGIVDLANFVDDAKRLSLLWLNNGGGGSPIQSIEDSSRNLCSSLNNLSRNLDVTSKALDRFSDAIERLALREAPIVLVKKEACEFGAATLVSGKEHRD